ncbi:sigma-70 family RNA polymerase sigma factor [Caulobacter sp.]|uniref:sigma-70 family RNA polymerase sigma factor n=1 Tax=Caulobacter sp. TaxID=78 RepID=UPI001B0D77F4|nr:sigma-70 family RNA polymerase sigma factor [Caulobacter sp.]MBO9545964.1 sigma-70 family RNA polymerase sigma factor [Caulobacter sp.]
MRRLSMPRLVFRREPAKEDQTAKERFQFLVLPHLDAAYGYARFLCREPTAAEDIVQEAFLRAYKAFGSCRGQEKAWLMAIVRNCWRDWATENGRAIPTAEPPKNAFFEPPDEETPLSLLERKSTVQTMRRCIDALPEPFREALVLRELEGLSYKEIAEATAAPIGTVMSRLARARDMLSAMLEPETEQWKKAR